MAEKDRDPALPDAEPMPEPALPDAEPMPEPAKRDRRAEAAERKAADLARGREKFQERARKAAEGVTDAK